MPPRGRRGVVPVRRPTKAAPSDWRGHADKAWSATREATKMLPAFNAFARSITGNKKIRVVLGDKFATDGNTIFIVPPIALGENRVHDKHLCNRRDEDRRMMCAACDSREMVVWPLYHEIGHIAFDTFEYASGYARSVFKVLVEDWHPYRVCAHGLMINEQADRSRACLDIAGHFDPYLLHLTNALEDSRVNSNMFRVRAGLRVMNEVALKRTFESGVEVPHTGDFVLWRDADINMQVIVGLHLIASGFEPEPGYLDPRVAEILNDDGLRNICSDVIHANSISEVFVLAINAWRRLQELGVCYKPKCEPSPEFPSLGKDGGTGSDEPNNDTKSEPGSGDKCDDRDASGSAGSGPGIPGGSGGGTGSDEAEPDSGTTGTGVHKPEDGNDGGSDPEDGTTGSAPNDSAVSDAGDDTAPEGGDEPLGESSGAGGDGSDTGPGEDPESKNEPGSGSEDTEHPEDPEGDSGSDSPKDGDVKGSEHSSDDTEEGSSQSGPDESDRHEGDEGSSDDLGDSGREGDDERAGESTDGPGDEDVSTEAELEGDDAFEGGDESGDFDEADPDFETSPYLTTGVRERPIVSLASDGDPLILGAFLNALNSHEVDSAPGSHYVDHGDPTEFGSAKAVADAIRVAVVQSGIFDTPSSGVTSARVFTYPTNEDRFTWDNRSGHDVADLMVETSIISSATLSARLVFNENARSKMNRGLKGGKINARVLGKRAPIEDERLFMKKTRPGKRDHFYVIGVDCSGSQDYGNRMLRTKRCAYAMAELLNRVGVKFAMYGHSGSYDRDSDLAEPGLQLWMMEIKGPDAPWDIKAKQALASLEATQANLDGHTLEFYRKVLDGRRETERGIMYYTDGAMPAENFHEELSILQSEIDTCKRRGYPLMGVGIDTDSPVKYGFDTCIVRTDHDLPKVVDHLKKKLMR